MREGEIGEKEGREGRRRERETWACTTIITSRTPIIKSDPLNKICESCLSKTSLKA